ncbi:MAG TPA: heme-binding protein [Usitatibacter sp.]|nr:heme-binding protein [Usitatibacter sp.]
MRDRLLALAMATFVAGCGGGGGSSSSSTGPGCNGACVTQASLAASDVQRIVSQAVAEATARNIHAQIAVVDRAGNVLAVFRMDGAPDTVAISSGLGAQGGLDGIPQGTIPASLAAITKALTGAYLSSAGNAFSTRTASQIIQEHFNPGEAQQPSGPLYGVQFSQLSCSDVNRNVSQGSVGPKRSPLGLAADPGGLPLYIGGTLVGGIGIEADGQYGIDRDIFDTDTNVEELVAVAGSTGYAAPTSIRGDHITGDGRTFRYVDSEAIVSNPANAPAFASLPGHLVAVDGYAGASVSAGTAFGSPASGVRADSGPFAAASGWILVDSSNASRFPPRAGTDGSLTAAEVTTLLNDAIAIAHRARGQIRIPLGSSAEVTMTVVDTNGEILGLVRTPDAPVFGIDVAVQKARTAMFFSSPSAAAALMSVPPAQYLSDLGSASIGDYVDRMRTFLGDPAALTGNIAWSDRALGNIHRPLFPDGIDGTPPGALSTPIASWSPFNVGFQLDLSYNQLVKGVLGDTSTGCAGRLQAGAIPIAADTGIPQLRNGVQIFPGSVPIYRGNKLVGAIGVSGDGVDQDDMISFLGLANAARDLGTGLSNAPAAMRADTLTPMGTRLRYAQCPQAPFNGSTDENVCAGL